MIRSFLRLMTATVFLLSFLTFAQENPATVNQEKLTRHKIDKVLVLSIDSSINPATYEYLKTAFSEIEVLGTQAVLIKINTPGGLVSTTKEILQLFGKTPLPLIIWVTPEGASATSAGALLAASAHFLFMSPGTNIGAATPVTITGDSPDLPAEKSEKKQGGTSGVEFEIDAKDAEPSMPQKTTKAMDKKIINDLVALVESLSTARGRNGDSFASMITEANSFTAEKALEKNIINGIASSEADIWKFIQGKKVVIQGIPKEIDCPNNPLIIKKEMDLGQWILNVFANPSFAYVLFLAGLVLIYLEMQAPGGYVAGGIGAICLLLCAISFQILPVNFGSLGLLVLAFSLFILEIYVTTYGLLYVVGILALLFGSLFLFRTEDSYLHLGHDLIYAVVLAIVVFLGLVFYFVIRDEKKRRQRNGHDLGIGGGGKKIMAHSAAIFPVATLQNGTVLRTIEAIPIAEGMVENKQASLHFYQVKIGGEIWKAFSEETEIYSEGTLVQVIATTSEALLVKIKKL